ncbi:hypothetical protein L914_03483 [Phytophthora nicotianae]|uniref:J domain-containing protein n=1 Tax=Phytophthora nicotianae TaxID=4792 RepID=W2NZ71_PHYNI|nr:hypothetical protein L914_03483 [Phytophthora nicotianae]
MTRKHLQTNYYDVLGVDRSASVSEIKAAYRKLVLEHHPDRYHGKMKKCVRYKSGKDAEILRINAAYDLLSDSTRRSKYDIEMFGVSAAPDASENVLVDTGNYKPMRSEDVHEMFGGLNEFERFTTAQYYRQRSHIAPAAIGRRATNFVKRKQFRAAKVKLPTQSATMAWFAFPVVLAALWGVNLNSIRNQSKDTEYSRDHGQEFPMRLR